MADHTPIADGLHDRVHASFLSMIPAPSESGEITGGLLTGTSSNLQPSDNGLRAALAFDGISTIESVG